MSGFALNLHMKNNKFKVPGMTFSTDTKKRKIILLDCETSKRMNSGVLVCL
jgi:hypothetical protein